MAERAYELPSSSLLEPIYRGKNICKPSSTVEETFQEVSGRIWKSSKGKSVREASITPNSYCADLHTPVCVEKAKRSGDTSKIFSDAYQVIRGERNSFIANTSLSAEDFDRKKPNALKMSPRSGLSSGRRLFNTGTSDPSSQSKIRLQDISSEGGSYRKNILPRSNSFSGENSSALQSGLSEEMAGRPRLVKRASADSILNYHTDKEQDFYVQQPPSRFIELQNTRSSHRNYQPSASMFETSGTLGFLSTSPRNGYIISFAKFQQLQGELSYKDERIAELEKCLNKTEADKRAVLMKLNSWHSSSQEDRNLTVDLRSQVEQEELKVKELAEECKSMGEKLSLEEDLRKNDKECIDILRGQISELEQKLQNSEELKKELELSNKTNLGLLSKIKENEEKTKQLKYEHELEIIDLKEKKHTIEAIAHRFESEISIQSDQIKRIEGRHARSQEVCAKYSQQITELQGTLEKGKDTVKTLYKEKKTLEDQQRKSESLQRRDQESSYVLQTQIVELQEKLEAAEKSNDDMEEERVVMENELAKSQNRVKDLEEKLKGKEDELKEMETKLKVKKQEKTDVDPKCIDREIKLLTLKLQAAECKLRDSERERSYCANKLQLFEKKLALRAERTRNSENFKEKFRQSEEQKSSLERAVTNIEEQKEGLNNLISLLENEVSILRQQNEELRLMISEHPHDYIIGRTVHPVNIKAHDSAKAQAEVNSAQRRHSMDIKAAGKGGGKEGKLLKQHSLDSASSVMENVHILNQQTEEENVWEERNQDSKSPRDGRGRRAVSLSPSSSTTSTPSVRSKMFGSDLERPLKVLKVRRLSGGDVFAHQFQTRTRREGSPCSDASMSPATSRKLTGSPDFKRKGVQTPDIQSGVRKIQLSNLDRIHSPILGRKIMGQLKIDNRV